MRRSVCCLASVFIACTGVAGESVDGESAGDAADAGAFDHEAPPSDGPGPSEDAPAPDGEPTAFDAFLATVPAGTWKAIPSTKMRDVCPAPLSTSNCDMVQAGWSGAAYDTRRERVIVFGGGHGDSYYNNVFVFDLGSMAWSRLTELPAGATSKAPTPEMKIIAFESCGYYPTTPLELAPADLSGNYLRTELCDRADVAAALDWQQPRSSHTYGKLAYDAARDRFCYWGGGTYPSAQAFTPWPQCFSFTTGKWERLGRRPAGLNGRGTTAIDAAGASWYLSDDTGPIARFTGEGAGTWTTFGAVNYDAVGTADVDRRRNHLWLMRSSGVKTSPEAGLYRYDLNDLDRLAMSRGDPDRLEGSGDWPTRSGRPGFVYADARDRFFGWSGGLDVFSLDPTTVAWTRLAGTGDDPGLELANGTYGRFRYSARYDVLVLVNGADRDVHVFKLP